jgi:hypothetical protein
MRKYAAATALAIALITMLTLTASASQTTPGALVSQRKNGDGCYGRDCHCSYQCYGKPGTLNLAKLRHCKPGAFCDLIVIPRDIHECLATCMAAQKAAQH